MTNPQLRRKHAEAAAVLSAARHLPQLWVLVSRDVAGAYGMDPDLPRPVRAFVENAGALVPDDHGRLHLIDARHLVDVQYARMVRRRQGAGA